MNDRFLKSYGPWALVTGASSGIGLEFSHQLAALRFNLVLVARRAERLTKLAEDLTEKYGIDVKTAVTDLSTSSFLYALSEITQGLEVGLLVNNAGFAVTGGFLEHKLDDELSLLHVNCRAPLVLSHHYGKLMVDRGRGGIINIASASALMPIPFWAGYSSSKVYLLHFSEALWFELKKRGVDVLAVCPGSTDTEFSRVAGTDMRGMSAEKVVKSSLENLGKKPSVLVGAIYSFSSFILRFISRKKAVKLASNVIGER